MTTAIIGTGGIGSVIARQLASGGETLWLSSADNNSAQRLSSDQRSVEPRMSPSTTATRCTARVPSFSRCGSSR
jgi:predicted dinucleotide-binding enzyme